MLDVLSPLINDIKSVINEYEETVLAGQSIQVRKCIVDLNYWIGELSKQAVPQQDADKAYRKLLTIVCLHKHYLEAAHETCLVKLINDKILKNREAIDRDNLYKILNYNKLPPNVTNDLAVDPTLDTKFTHEVQQMEVDSFKAALKKLREHEDQLDKDSVLHFIVKLFADTLQAEFYNAQQFKNNKFDTKYHTNLLIAATEYLKSPNENQLAKFSALLNVCEAGQTSYTQRRRGIGMMIIGAVIAGAGIALGITSMGVASPVTLMVIAFGFFVFSAGYATTVHARQRNIGLFGKDIVETKQACLHKCRPDLVSPIRVISNCNNV